jgi:DNA (cytosine-5)-methyltransferase 1
MSKVYKVASFFTGLGGMDLGGEGDFDFLGHHYKKNPLKTVYAMDFDKPICDIYNANFGIECQHKDINLVSADEIPDHDILTGGFPCQSFSVVAQNPKRLGYKDDKKGKLFFEMCRILKEKKPAVFVAENVKGLLSANKGEAFPLVIQEFENAGYHVKYKVLNASHYGVPQKRERVFIVGFRDKQSYDAFEFPEPVTVDSPRVIKEIIDPEHTIEDKYYFSKKAVQGMQATKHAKTMKKGRAQDVNQPSNTVGAHLAKVSLNSTDPVLCIDGRYRMFTPREVARIQSFPESFKLPGSRTTNYKALGNAVAPVVMWHVAQSIITALKAVESSKTAPVPVQGSIEIVDEKLKLELLVA